MLWQSLDGPCPRRPLAPDEIEIALIWLARRVTVGHETHGAVKLGPVDVRLLKQVRHSPAVNYVCCIVTSALIYPVTSTILNLNRNKNDLVAAVPKRPGHHI